MSDDQNKLVTFIQNDLPALVAGSYDLSVEQTVNQADPGSFNGEVQFAVSGPRFALPGTEIQSVFPPALSNGEFSGILPHAVINKRTLPWSREAQEGNRMVSWLAVLTFNEDEFVKPKAMTAKDLIADGEAITVTGSTTKGTGALPAGYLSYPKINPLDYGESPDDECKVMDLPVALFNQIAPSLNDLENMAHIRKVDTMDSEDHVESELQLAVVLGNRLPEDGKNAYAVLVSLEHMADYLPADDGTPSTKIPAGTKFVRLTALKEWRFFNNAKGKVLVNLLEGLNETPDVGATSLRMPPASTAAPNPDPSAVQVALNHQANGKLSDADADVLVQNAFAMGYLPMTHNLRDAGVTASWYRGPLAPFGVDLTVPYPKSTSDGMLRFNPETGLFDVSYASAWQLGQLMGLQSKGFANQLYQWKRGLKKGQAAAAEQQLLEQAFEGADHFSALLRKGRDHLMAKQGLDIPQAIVDFVARMRLLDGVPFAYLVPSELMLPPESLRWFQLDIAWVNALVDGAFSIGRASLDDMKSDTQLVSSLVEPSCRAARARRKNPKPANLVAPATNGPGPVTGVIMRSQAAAGWPRLRIKGYQDTAGEQELPKLRFTRLSKDTLLCLFDGVAQLVSVSEPPEALHCGVEGEVGKYTTTLRAVTGDTPGKQIPGDNAFAATPNRTDGQTIEMALSAKSIEDKLNADFGQKIKTFTSAELALEMIKGTVQVNYQVKNG